MIRFEMRGKGSFLGIQKAFLQVGEGLLTRQEQRRHRSLIDKSAFRFGSKCMNQKNTAGRKKQQSRNPKLVTVMAMIP